MYKLILLLISSIFLFCSSPITAPTDLNGPISSKSQILGTWRNSANIAVSYFKFATNDSFYRLDTIFNVAFNYKGTYKITQDTLFTYTDYGTSPFFNAERKDDSLFLSWFNITDSIIAISGFKKHTQYIEFK